MRLAVVGAAIVLMACGSGQTATDSSPVAQSPGPLGDTWTYDGTSWHRAATTGPSPRYMASVAFDAARDVYVLFGGNTPKGPSDETWTWDGRIWKLMHPAHKPPARHGAAMAYDDARHVVVLYGGLVSDNAEGHETGDTWDWNGADWTQNDAGPGAPRERRGAEMVAAQGRLILFGGNVFNTTYFGDAWSWDGHVWSIADSAPRPPGRGGAAAAWDPADSALLVYGGSGFNAAGGPGALGAPLADLWSLTGGSWRLLASGPGKLAFANAMWDARAERFVVLLGMTCPNPTAAAWAWDGKTWTELANPGLPARWGASLGQAPNGHALLFGGSNESGC